MANPVISARNVSKLYLLGERHPRYRTLRDTIAERIARGLRPPTAAEEKSILWALKDVSFDVAQGEVLGVIGRNGAGKSTLLKILSEITSPTEGRVEIRGRVGSLLEVGTGFHPELTGRENIFLNGAILGMTRAEIIRKFDEIVAFAEIDRFIDTPVKRYSSGMYVRLAFAVAAHLEPEILLIDEVLAVGDASFQRKCMGKMSDVAHGGRTVLFISHNMAAVESLCSRVILLDGGRIAAEGVPDNVISGYLGAIVGAAGEVDLLHLPRRPGAKPPLLHRWRILDRSGLAVAHVPVGVDVTFAIEGETQQSLSSASFGVRFMRPTGERVMTCHTDYQYGERITLHGRFRVSCQIRNCRLMPGQYVVGITLRSAHDVEDEVEGVPFEVTPRDIYGTGKLLPPRCGAYVPDVEWSVTSAP